MSNNTLDIENKIISKKVKIYSLIIALLPILSIYSSGIPGINLGELLLVLFFSYLILQDREKSLSHKPINSLIFLIWYIGISTLVAMIFDSSQINNVLIRTIRFTFYVLTIYFLSWKYFSAEFASFVIKIVSILATIYIIIQNISYSYFSVILKGFLPFIPVYTTHYESYDYAGIYQMIFYRPTSFFLEPAHYTQYVLLGLAVYLFKEKFNLTNILCAIFLTMGILISTSGQGLVIATTIWLIYMFHLIFHKSQSKKKRFFGVILPIILVAVLPFVLSRDVIQNNLSRISASGSNTAVAARTEGYIAYISGDNFLYKIFGYGYGNTPDGVWYSSLAYILYCSGIIGFLIVMGIFIKYYIRSDNIFTKMLIILCFSLSASAEIIHSFWIVLMFSLFCYPSISSTVIKNRSKSRSKLSD